MNLQKLQAMFLLADIDVFQIKMVPNGYWPDSYVELNRANPWFEVSTPMGVITIGWRKRVIEITWKNIPVNEIITQDDTDKGHRYVHAWNYGAAVTYLANLRRHYEMLSQEQRNERQE